MSVCSFNKQKINPQKSKYIQKYINTKVDIKQNIPFGFTSFVNRNGDTDVYTYGKRNIEENLPFEADSIYRMASQSKFMGTTAFLKLIDNHRLDLSDPIKNYISEYSMENMGVIEPYELNSYEKILINPIKTVKGSNIITILHSDHPFKENDRVSLEWSNGSLDISKNNLPDANGIPGFEVFNIHTIFNVTEHCYDIKLNSVSNKDGMTGSFVKIRLVPNCDNNIRRSICLSPDRLLVNPKVTTYYYKTVPLNRELTILDVLNHGLGWSYYSSSMLYMSFGYAKDPIKQSIQAGLWNETGLPIGLPLSCFDGNIRDWVKMASKIPLLYQPGADWSYGPQLSILGALIEVITDKSVETYMKEELWDPLEMNNTGFFIHDNDPDYDDKVFRTSKLYINMPKMVLKFIGMELFYNLPVEEAQYCLYSGPRKLPLIDCGMYTTVNDYLKFMKMYLNKGRSDSGVIILSENMIKIISKYNTCYDVSNLSTVSGYTTGLSLPGTASDIKREKLLTSMRWGLGVGTIQGCKNNPYNTENADNISNNIQAITWAGVLGTRFLIDFCSGIAYNVGTNVIGPPAGTIDSDLIELNYKEMSKEGYKQMIHEMII